jgi:TonB family protein
VVKAPQVDYGKARKAAQRTLDSFVGGMTPAEAIPDAQAFVQIIERAAQTPTIADMPRIGRSGRLRRAPRIAVPERPPGDDGLGSTGAPDFTRVGKTLRMNADLMRRHPYWKEVYDRVQPLWSFPVWAEEQMLQGEVHLAFDFDPETGRAHNFEVIRRSRIDEFDANVIKAVKEASPFGRVPVDAPAATRLIWPFKFRNPVF